MAKTSDPLPIFTSEPIAPLPPSVREPEKTCVLLSPPTIRVPLVRLTVPAPAKEPIRSA